LSDRMGSPNLLDWKYPSHWKDINKNLTTNLNSYRFFWYFLVHTDKS